MAANGATFADEAAGTVSVPEPASLALLGVGLFGFGLAKGRRRQHVAARPASP